jgi:hypothetical protein
MAKVTIPSHCAETRQKVKRAVLYLGQFAAWEQPKLFSAEIRAASRSLRVVSVSCRTPPRSTALSAATTVVDFEEVVPGAIGSSDLMEVARFDTGEVLRLGDLKHESRNPKAYPRADFVLT